jgi:hypothetical protein
MGDIGKPLRVVVVPKPVEAPVITPAPVPAPEPAVVPDEERELVPVPVRRGRK